MLYLKACVLHTRILLNITHLSKKPIIDLSEMRKLYMKDTEL